MNELLQQHGCSNVFTVPDGLKELMSDITREVLRDQPSKIFDYIANYLSVLLITREHGVLAVKILEDLCDCKPTVEEHLHQLGLHKNQAVPMAQLIKEEIEGFEPKEGKEKIRELQIMKKLLSMFSLDEAMSAKICQIVRNTYRDYWYRKKLMEKSLSTDLHETWEIAAEHTLEIYKRTKPSFSELSAATTKIQAAYRGFYVRKNILRHLKPKPKKAGPKVELPGPPLDIASSREINLGPRIQIKVRDEDVSVMFEEEASEKLGLRYDTTKTITHVEEEPTVTEQTESSQPVKSIRTGGLKTQKGVPGGSAMKRGHSESVAFETPSQFGMQPRHLLQGSESKPKSLYGETPQQSRKSSQTTEDTTLNKISFSNATEVFHIDSEDGPGLRGQEIVSDDEVAQEIPEEIMGGGIQGDDDIPAGSVPSSAPETDIEFATDVDTEAEDNY